MADKRETISIEAPKEWAEAVKKFIAEVDGASPEIRGGRAVDYAAFERPVEESTPELEKNAHRRFLQDLDIDAERSSSKGSLTLVSRGTSRLTKRGPVSVMRSLYREDGRRNARRWPSVSGERRHRLRTARSTTPSRTSRTAANG